MKIDQHNPDKGLTKQEIIAKKQHELKLLGKQVKPFKNARLFQLNMDKLEIEEIALQPKRTAQIRFDKDVLRDKNRHENAGLEVVINRKWPTVWALNRKNAKNKFLKLKFEVWKNGILGQLKH